MEALALKTAIAVILVSAVLTSGVMPLFLAHCLKNTSVVIQISKYLPKPKTTQFVIPKW